MNGGGLSTGALDATVIHRCGAAFVHHIGRAHCPDCYASIAPFAPKHRSKGAETLRLINPATGAELDLRIADGATVTIGRRDIPDASGKVSGKHLELRRRGRRIHLRHIGRNPTVDLDRGERLTDRWLDLDDPQDPLIRPQLADTEVEIGR